MHSIAPAAATKPGAQDEQFDCAVALLMEPARQGQQVSALA